MVGVGFGFGAGGSLAVVFILGVLVALSSKGVGIGSVVSIEQGEHGDKVKGEEERDQEKRVKEGIT